MHSLDFLVIRKHDKVCDEIFLEQCVPIDRHDEEPALSRLFRLSKAPMANTMSTRLSAEVERARFSGVL